MSDTALTLGVRHVGLTVPNLDQARGFFTEQDGPERGGARLPLSVAAY